MSSTETKDRCPPENPFLTTGSLPREKRQAVGACPGTLAFTVGWLQRDRPSFFLREEGMAYQLVLGMSGPVLRGSGHRLPRA